MKVRNFIAIIDFGSQYTHLIGRALKQLDVAFEILPPTTTTVKLKNAAGIILSGGPSSVVKNPIPYNPEIIKLPQPILGVCYGLQLLAQAMGGKVTPGKIREYGLAKLKIISSNKLLTGLPKSSTVWMSHGDSVTKLPKNFITLASTENLKYACLAHQTKPIWGIQFHAEVHHTKYGKLLLENFVFKICQIKPTTTTGLLEKISAQTKTQVGGKKVFLLVSGGVDSTVAFALLNKILGPKQVYGLHVDTGLMRFEESTKVKQALGNIGFKNLHIINASRTFFQNLKNVTEPEAKRKIIGQTFLDVKQQVEKKLKLDTKHWLLGQGTIYPDTIESGGTKHADKIKTHHNRIGILTKLARNGLLVEPLKELYKDEVRTIGEELGLPHELLWTHPFPGPGLGVRILCLNNKNVQELNNQITPTIKIKQFNTRILPLLSVGVQGDERSYRKPLAVEASFSKAKRLHHIATQIINKNHSINRVILKLSGPSIKIRKSHSAYITPARVKLLQQIDNIVITILHRAGLYYKMWQCPVVLAPFGEKNKESVILRPFESREAMTGQAYVLPQKVVTQIVESINNLKKIDYIFYDLTNKPPGTVEWE